MTREVFIFGTCHELQCGAAECEADNISLLEREIRRIVTKYGIRRIAEEMSDDALQKSSAGDQAPKKTVCQRIAGDDVPVHFVDLDVKERACLSLSSTNIGYKLCDEVRERVCVARILSRDEWPVLFVCGSNHAVPVSVLFNCIGVQATVICHDFDPDAIRDMVANWKQQIIRTDDTEGIPT